MIVGAVVVEAYVAKDPIIPLRLFKDRTTTLATGASVLIGVAMFGATVYLSQYFQLARGMSPTTAGLMSICMVGGLLVSSIICGRIITATGKWKKFLIGGMVLVIIGLALLSTIDDTTNLVVVGVFMAILGLGLGATMQNTVLAVQNSVAAADLGSGSSVVAFFRSMGGSIGVSALGAALGHQVSDHVSTGLTALVKAGTIPAAALADLGANSRGDPRPGHPVAARCAQVFEHAFGEATGHLFLIALPFAVLSLAAVALHRGEADAHDRAPRRRDRCCRARSDAPTGEPESRERTILDLELELSRLVRRIKRVIGERARSIHPELTPTGYLVLAYIIEHGSVRPSAVVEAFNLDKGAVSRHVQTLVDFGLATKERDPDDGRAWVVSRDRRGSIAHGRARRPRAAQSWAPAR